MKTTFAQIFAPFQGKKEELIPILQQVQTKFGYLSREAMLAVAKFTRIAESEVYGVATFYAQFRFTPIGKKHVMVCRGTACHVRGAPQVLEEFTKQLHIQEGETSKDGKYSLETVACIGCCGLAPCAMVEDKVEAKLTKDKVKKLVQDWS
jgi:NADH-quinone oxidoreductase subunit E